jgi:putative copper resistance protein D
VKKLVRSRPVQWLTWPVFGVVAYAATIVGTHLTNFMNLVTEHDAIHQAEHVLYLVVGYLYFLPLIGKEPIRWKVSYPLRLFLLFIVMPIDTFTGVVLGSYQTDPFVPMDPRSWGPSAVDDLHEGGAVMWIGGAAIMFVLIMVTFFQWTRETRPSASMGWLESARQVNMAERFAEADPASAQVRDGVSSGAARNANVDEDEDQLAAYNDYLARINRTAGRESGPAAE